jgi:hypothetical protein
MLADDGITKEVCVQTRKQHGRRQVTCRVPALQIGQGQPTFGQPPPLAKTGFTYTGVPQYDPPILTSLRSAVGPGNVCATWQFYC